MRAWWVYWIAIGITAVLWIGAPLLLGRDGFRDLLHQPVPLAILLLPLVVAGIDLILFRASHEQVCRLEVQRHRSFRTLAGDGYSARTFAATGVVTLAVVILVIGAVATDRL